MNDLFTILTYPLQRITALLFSLVIADGVSIGALIVSACLLMILFKALIGIHLSVFNNERSESEEEQIEKGVKNRRISEEVDRRSGPRQRWQRNKNGSWRFGA